MFNTSSNQRYGPCTGEFAVDFSPCAFHPLFFHASARFHFTAFTYFHASPKLDITRRKHHSIEYSSSFRRGMSHSHLALIKQCCGRERETPGVMQKILYQINFYVAFQGLSYKKEGEKKSHAALANVRFGK